MTMVANSTGVDNEVCRRVMSTAVRVKPTVSPGRLNFMTIRSLCSGTSYNFSVAGRNSAGFSGAVSVAMAAVADDSSKFRQLCYIQ